MFAMLLSICLLQPTAASGSWENEFQRYQASGGVTEPKYTSADLTNATMTATPRPSFDPNLARKPTAASGSWENKFQLYQPSNKIPYWKNPSIFQEEPKYTSADLTNATMTAAPRPSFDPNLPSGFEPATVTANGLSFNPNCQQNNRLTSGSSESRDPTPGSSNPDWTPSRGGNSRDSNFRDSREEKIRHHLPGAVFHCKECDDTGLEDCTKKDCTNDAFMHFHDWQQCTRPCRCVQTEWRPTGLMYDMYSVDEESRGRRLSKGTFADLVKQIDEQGC